MDSGLLLWQQRRSAKRFLLVVGYCGEGLEVAETQIGTAKASNNLRQLEQCRYAAVGGTKDWR